MSLGVPSALDEDVDISFIYSLLSAGPQHLHLILTYPKIFEHCFWLEDMVVNRLCPYPCETCTVGSKTHTCQVTFRAGIWRSFQAGGTAGI